MCIRDSPGVEDMNAALSLKGKELYIRREDAQLPPGQWFDDELLGLPVFDLSLIHISSQMATILPQFRVPSAFR